MRMRNSLVVALLALALPVLAVGAERQTATRGASLPIRIDAGGLRADLRTGEQVQAVTLTNIGTRDIAGRVALVLDGLPPGVRVAGPAADGRGRALISGLKAGESRTLVLRFSAPSAADIRYRPRLVAPD